MGQFTPFSAHWPFLVTVTPLFGAALAAIQGRRGVAAARQSAMVNSTLTLIAALLMAAQFAAVTSGSNQPVGVQMSSELFRADLSSGDRMMRWRIAFGVDGISLGPMLIIAVIGWVAIWAAGHSARDWSASSYVGLLIGQSLALAMFAAQDALLFLAAAELGTWWLFAMTGRHGGTDRRAAARQVLIVGWFSHALWGLAIIGLADCDGWIQTMLSGDTHEMTFHYAEIIAQQVRRILGNEAALRVWLTFEPWIVPLWIAGLIVRWPLVPFHGWWPRWVSQARPPVAVLGGAVLLLETGYVWFRFVAPFDAAGSIDGSPWLGLWAAAGLVWCGLSAVGETNSRRLVGLLATGSLQLALIGVVSHSIAGELAGAQMLGGVLLAAATALLSLGCEDSPSDRILRSGSLVILGLLPLTMFVTGGATIWLVEGRGYGLVFLAVAIGGLLMSWAAIRAAFEGWTSGEDTVRSVGHRRWLIGLPAALVVVVGLSPGWWQPVLRPAWEALHDPFAATQSISLRKSPASSPESALVADQELPLWRSASAIWAACGVALMLWPRAGRSSNWPCTVALLGLIAGIVVELWPLNFSAWHHSPTAIGLSAFLLGWMGLSMRERGGCPSAEISGAWLLRLAAAAFAAQTRDLVLIGLAWELAELTRGLLSEGTNIARDRWRMVLSSCCFWLGVAMFYGIARTTQFDVIAAQLAETQPRNADNEVIGSGSALGLAGTILILSAIGSRCGLLPWSFGRDFDHSMSDVINGWLDRLVGLAMLLALLRLTGKTYGDALSIMLCVSAAATAVWSAVAVVGEHRIPRLLSGVLSWQFAGLTLFVAAAAVQSANAREEAMPIGTSVAGAFLALTAALCGIVAATRWIGQPAGGEMFIEHHQGLLMKRPQPAITVMLLVIGLIAGCPLWGFWLRLTDLVQLTMTLLHAPDDELRLHPVLLSVAIVIALTGVVQITRLAEWLRAIAFDPPVSIFPTSGRRWAGVVAWIAAAAMLFGAAWI